MEAGDALGQIEFAVLDTVHREVLIDERGDPAAADKPVLVG
jgi:hypothetical protein